MTAREVLNELSKLPDDVLDNEIVYRDWHKFVDFRINKIGLDTSNNVLLSRIPNSTTLKGINYAD